MRVLGLNSLYIITNGSGEVVDPNEKAFLFKIDAKEYIKKNWTTKEIKEMGIEIESIAEALGLE